MPFDLAAGIAIDLELDGRNDLIAIGAVRGEQQFTGRGSRGADFTEIDELAVSATCVVGHNILWHDLPWLQSNHANSALLRLPRLDTLAWSALAFAEYPYHQLLKDHKLARDAINDPVADARASLRLLADERTRFATIFADDPPFGRVLRSLAAIALETIDPLARAGSELWFAELTSPADDLDAELLAWATSRTCRAALATLTPVRTQPPERRLAWLFVLAWLRVAGTATHASPSVMPRWLRERVPAVTELVIALRDRPCTAPECTWCRTAHDPTALLVRWYRFPSFRGTTLADGRPAQATIVAAGMADRPHLALLPTGGGKSLCFQLPAIARYLRRGCLTLVVSPLQALMRDQVDNFARKTGAEFAFALTGGMTQPERREALDALRSGRAGILYVAPEQLRNGTFADALDRRELGAVVFDEAHCLSKWGHDFRPDYLYAARFLRERSERLGVQVPTITCVTATAKPAVRDEILAHFRSELGQDLAWFDGQAPRTDLTLAVEAVPGPAKDGRLREVVGEVLMASSAGAVLVYAATRKTTERLAAMLAASGLDAAEFHAGLEPDQKRSVQQRFLDGTLRVVCATNAFGMGIDKPDIRLVVHYEMPGSPENYVQEVGRAGRDERPARAVLLFDDEDAETQFRLAARSRLQLRDLQGVLRRVRQLARPTPEPDQLQACCTTGEILRDDRIAESIDPSDRGAPTKVLTAIAWLERGRFLRRDENHTRVFQGRPRVPDLATARERIAALGLSRQRIEARLAILERLLQADVDEGLSTDDLLSLPGVLGMVAELPSRDASRALLRLLWDMQKERLLSSDTHMTAFVRHAVADASKTRLERTIRLERAMLGELQLHAPDLADGDGEFLSLARLHERLRHEHADSDPERLRLLLLAAQDRAAHAGERASGLRVQFVGAGRCRLQLRGSWQQAVDTATRRHRLADCCLHVMLAKIAPQAPRDTALLVEFTLEELQRAVDQDLVLRSDPSRDPVAELEYALLYLHRAEVLLLHKGLAVFRQAMALRLDRGDRRRVQKDHYQPLHEHQLERTVQIHVMHAFAKAMTTDRERGLRLLDDWFRLDQDAFLTNHFRHRRTELLRPTTAASWQRITGELTEAQRAIVTARDRAMLVLAGPGSGKTRVVVHRCAWLLRVHRVPANALLVLCFNRSAALELRHRLVDLVGDDARGVLVQTYHGLAARLAGRSPADELEQPSGDGPRDDETLFRELLQAAIDLLEQGGGEGDDALRDRLLDGFQHILVDEYQDIDALQYRLVSAIAGRTLRDPERKLAVLAVGDDDQNIYSYRGSNVEFLRRFQADYEAKELPLLENHRSTAHIVAAANDLIAQNRDRMKSGQPMRLPANASARPAGGSFAALDGQLQGRVHALVVPGPAQPAAIVRELQRLRACDPTFTWQQCAILSPRHALLDPVRTALEADGIPVQVRVDGATAFSLFRLRVVQDFLAAVGTGTVERACLLTHAARLRANRPRETHCDLVDETLRAFLVEHGDGPHHPDLLTEFFGEQLREQRRERLLGSGVTLATVHGSKGTEYAHVFVLDGDWRPREGDDVEERRRLYYVAMTRAQRTLTLLQHEHGGAPWVPAFHGAWLHRSRPQLRGPWPASQRYTLLGFADLDLGFAGRHGEHAAIATAAAQLATGDALLLATRGERLVLTDRAGQLVGALSQTATTKWRALLPAVVAIRVAGILVRHRAEEAEGYRENARRDTWHVVVPEVVTST